MHMLFEGQNIFWRCKRQFFEPIGIWQLRRILVATLLSLSENVQISLWEELQMEQFYV